MPEQKCFGKSSNICPDSLSTLNDVCSEDMRLGSLWHLLCGTDISHAKQSATIALEVLLPLGQPLLGRKVPAAANHSPVNNTSTPTSLQWHGETLICHTYPHGTAMNSVSAWDPRTGSHPAAPFQPWSSINMILLSISAQHSTTH